MKLLIDTNIVLDVLLKRDPFYVASANVMSLAGHNNIKEYISASAVTDIYYIAHRQMRDRAAVKELLNKLLMVVSVAAVSEQEICSALKLDWPDFEDSVQYSVALLGEMDGIVTRNPNDYRDAEICIWGPEQLLKEFEH